VFRAQDRLCRGIAWRDPARGVGQSRKALGALDGASMSLLASAAVPSEFAVERADDGCCRRDRIVPGAR